MDDGATIIRLMNEAGYDLATPGNHEFDYGMDRAKMVLKEADFPYVSCNWIDLRSGLRVLPSIKLFNIKGAFVAFVGITTPETFTKSTPAYFMNAKPVSYTHLRAHETDSYLVCRLLLEKKKKHKKNNHHVLEIPRRPPNKL